MFTRFGIKSTESGLIASSYDIASFLCLLPVSYLGGRPTGSKPLWIGTPSHASAPFHI
jgi:organic anion transporter 4A